MEDPRIAELLEYVDSVDEAGNPTQLALIARRVKTYLDAVEKLRAELDEYHEKVESLEARAENLSRVEEERKLLRGDMKQIAQDSAMRAALSNTSLSAHLRKDAQQKHKGLQQFEQDSEEDARRLKEVTRALENNRNLLVDTRDQIARRMNIVDTLLERAEIEWPSYYLEENKRLKKPGEVGRPVRRRPRGRRVVRRRAS